MLIDAGADVDARGESGETPAMNAVAMLDAEGEKRALGAAVGQSSEQSFKGNPRL